MSSDKFQEFNTQFEYSTGNMINSYQVKLFDKAVSNKFVMVNTVRSSGTTTFLAEYVKWRKQPTLYLVHTNKYAEDLSREHFGGKGTSKWSDGDIHVKEPNRVEPHESRGKYNIIVIDGMNLVKDQDWATFFSLTFPYIQSRPFQMIISGAPAGPGKYFQALYNVMESILNPQKTPPKIGK